MNDNVQHIFPFAFEIDEQGHEKILSREAELALIFSAIEERTLVGPPTTSLFEKVKRKFLKKETELEKAPSPEARNVGLIMKMLYPAWIVPLGGDKYIFVEGLGFLTSVLKYDELPDFQAFLENLKESTTVEQYLEVMRKHYMTFLSFKETRSFVMNGIPSEENLVLDLQASMSHFREEEIFKAISINPRVTWKQANSNTKKVQKLIVDIEKDIKKLVSTKELLASQSKKYINQLEDQMKAMKEEASQCIEKEENASRTIIESIQKEYQFKVTETEKTAIEEIEKIKQKQNEQNMEILDLENQEKEQLKKLDTLKSKKENSNTELSNIATQREKLLIEKEDLEAKIKNDKMEEIKLQGLAEACKEEEREIEIRKDKEQIEKKIKKTNESIFLINSEASKLDKELERIKSNIDQLSIEINILTKTIEKINFSKTKKKKNSSQIPQQIEDIRRRTDEKLTKMSEEYGSQVKEQELKTKELRVKIIKELKIKQRIIDELTKRTKETSSQIENLIRNKTKSLEDINKITISLPKEDAVKEITLFHIPFYLIEYETPSETVCSLLSPLATSPIPEGIPGIKEPFVQPTKTGFDKILKIKLLEAMKYDTALYREIQEGSSIVNLLKDTKTLEYLFRGITELKLSEDKIQQLKVRFSEYFHKK